MSNNKANVIIQRHFIDAFYLSSKNQDEHEHG